MPTKYVRSDYNVSDVVLNCSSKSIDRLYLLCVTKPINGLHASNPERHTYMQKDKTALHEQRELKNYKMYTPRAKRLLDMLGMLITTQKSKIKLAHFILITPPYPHYL